MAARDGLDQFLSTTERAKLQIELSTSSSSRKKMRLLPPMSPGGDHPLEEAAEDDEFSSQSPGFLHVLQEEPCRLCGKDSDHANLLICDKCEGHFHTYCLDPPLKEIPEEDWFCAVCKPDLSDGLEELVSALPPHIKSRFGEICWAQGGVGYGWWPCCIYDPRLTMGITRSQARKQIGKKLLVYFLQCDETPFDLLTDNKIMSWEEGMAEDFYLGKTAKAAGRHRFARFLEALQAATIEESKPVELRLDFSRSTPGQPQLLPSPVKINSVRSRQQGGSKKNRKKRSRQDSNAASGNSKQARRENSTPADGDTVDEADDNNEEEVENEDDHPIQSLSRINYSSSSLADSVASSTQKGRQKVNPTSADQDRNVNDSGDSALFCQVYRLADSSQPGVCVGFVELPSRENSTFAEARLKIEEVIEPQYLFEDWRFLHPKLGPVSMLLEKKVGPMLAYLNKGSRGSDKADGTIEDPVRVSVIAAPDPLAHKNKPKSG